MHSANLTASPRLQRVYNALLDGAEHSTRELMWQADVCAVSTIVGELRDNGCSISCRQTTINGNRIWMYKMVVDDRRVG